MFKTLDTSEPYWKNFPEIACQTIAIPLASLAVVFTIVTVLSDVFLVFGRPGGGLDSVLGFLMYSVAPLTGFLLGYRYAPRYPSWFVSAQQVWKVPGALYLILIGNGLLKYGLSDLRAFFAPDVLLFAITIPAVSCCCYSCGAVAARRRLRLAERDGATFDA
jgi:hypothetical protein